MSLLGERAITRRTWAAGAWASGTFTRGAAADSPISGTWRPMPAREVQLLESGDRERDPRVLYTATELLVNRQGTGVVSDHVSPDAGTTWYEVITKYDGTADTAQLGVGVNHWRYAALRIVETE